MKRMQLYLTALLALALTASVSADPTKTAGTAEDSKEAK